MNKCSSFFVTKNYYLNNFIFNTMFGNTKGKNTEGLSIATLGPGIYQGYSLLKVEFTKTTKGDGTEGKNIITFLFDGPQGPHQHTEFEPTDADATKLASKSENLSKRVTHIMTKFVPQEVADAVSGADFASYAQAVVATLNPAVTAPVKDLEIKVLGSVYDGKATSAIPGYPPFIARKSQASYKPLNLTDRERKGNAEYASFHSASPDNDSTPTTSSNSNVDADF